MPMQRIGLDAGRAMPVTVQGRVTRDAIIRAALVEIGECGYLDARVESITNRASVGYGTFYKYFSSKRDLVRAAMSDVFEDIFASPTERPAAGGTSVAQDVHLAIVARLRAYHHHRRTLRVLDSAIGVDPGLASVLHDLQRQQVESYAGMLAATPGYHPAGAPLSVSFVVNSLIDEVARRWVRCSDHSRPSASPDAEVAEIANTVLPMILAVVAPGQSHAAATAVAARAPASMEAHALQAPPR